MVIFLLSLFLPLTLGLPVFPKDWTAIESQDLVVHQGAYTIVGNTMCCPLNDNCQVQTQFQSGKHSFDYTHNRTRYDYDTGEIIVNDYVIGKEMEVQATSEGTFACVEYCPLQFDLEPLSVDKSAKDEGSVKIGNKTYEKWTWKDIILKVIVMETIEMLVDQSTTPNIPFVENEELTPFGQDIGTSNTTYSDFVVGTPDPMLFKVANVSSCPMSPNCGSLIRQSMRLRDGNYNQFLYYRNQKKE